MVSEDFDERLDVDKEHKTEIPSLNHVGLALFH